MTDIFISYNHKDEAWKDELQAHLDVLYHHGSFKVWEDRQIKAGDDWYPEIKKAISKAKVAILLVSRDFLISEFVNNEEIPALLKRRNDGGLRIIPLVVRPCAWRDVPWLSALQGAMKDNQPLSRLEFGSFELEYELSEFASEVHNQLKLIKEQEYKQARVEENFKKIKSLASERQMLSEQDPHIYNEPLLPKLYPRVSVWSWFFGLAILAFVASFGAQVIGRSFDVQAVHELTLDEKIEQARKLLESEDFSKEQLAIEQLEKLKNLDFHAKFLLGAGYFYGLGVDKNKVKGCNLYVEAAKSGSMKAKEVLDAKLCE